MKQILLVEDDHDIAALLRLNPKMKATPLPTSRTGATPYSVLKNSRGTR